MRMRVSCSALLCSVARICTAADAQAPAAAAAPPSAASGLLQATLGLAVVLAAIWATAWIMRRIAPTRSLNSPIKVLATQSVGQRERVVLIEVADSWLLVGVAPGSVTALQSMPKSTLPDARPTTAPFERLLALAKIRRQP